MQALVLGAKAKGGGAHSTWVTDVAWSPDSEYHLTSVALDGELKLWDTRAAVPLHTLKAHPQQVSCPTMHTFPLLCYAMMNAR